MKELKELLEKSGMRDIVEKDGCFFFSGNRSKYFNETDVPEELRQQILDSGYKLMKCRYGRWQILPEAVKINHGGAIANWIEGDEINAI